MLVITPVVPETPEGVNTIRLGVLKLARFRRSSGVTQNRPMRVT